MNTSDPLDNYVTELERELRDVPRSRRRELVADVRAHVTEAAPVGEAELRTLLERLGSPAEIAEAELGPGDQQRRRGFGLEIVALILLAIGFALIPFIGWFVGVALLWGSSAWTTREKLLGTFVFPGGFVLPFYVVLGLAGPTSTRSCVSSTVNGRPTAEVCTSTGPDKLEQVLIAAGLLVMLLGSIATIAFLARRMRRGARA